MHSTNEKHGVSSGAIASVQQSNMIWLHDKRTRNGPMAALIDTRMHRHRRVFVREEFVKYYLSKDRYGSIAMIQNTQRVANTSV